MLTSVLLFLFLSPTAQGEEPAYELPDWARAVEFRASDDHPVTAAFFPARVADSKTPVKERPVLLLCHQSASNYAEYGPIAPRLAAAGFHCLALDMRGGGPNYGRVNLTREAWELATGERGGGPQARLDMEGALAWLADEGFEGPLTIWGSSYSAGRLFELVMQRPSSVQAIVSFSPGHGFARRGPNGEKAWAEHATQPVFMTWAPHELDDERRAEFARVASETKVLFEQEQGVHGSSTLHPQKNPGGTEPTWEAVLAFLDAHAR